MFFFSFFFFRDACSGEVVLRAIGCANKDKIVAMIIIHPPLLALVAGRHNRAEDLCPQ